MFLGRERYVQQLLRRSNGRKRINRTMKHTLQALDEGNITFLKADKTQASQKFDFIRGFIFVMTIVTIGYFLAILLA